jgi:hypothetical protein
MVLKEKCHPFGLEITETPITYPYQLSGKTRFAQVLGSSKKK